MDPALQSAWLKLRRARDDISVFDEHMKRFRETQPYIVTRELERDGAEHVYRVEVRAEPPLYLGTIVGDVLHNLRSALDSIVWDLSAAAIPSLTERERQRISFPIASRDEFLDRSRIEHVSEEAAKTEIERSQPYCEWDPAWGEPLHHPLWQLQRLSNLDKHRFVHPVPAYLVGSMWIYPRDLDFEQREHAFGTFEDRAELVRFVFSEPHPEVDMSFNPMIDVSLGIGNERAGKNLLTIWDHIMREVVPRFLPFFPRVFSRW